MSKDKRTNFKNELNTNDDYLKNFNKNENPFFTSKKENIKENNKLLNEPTREKNEIKNNTNYIRTKLLIYIDEEHSKYLKNCLVKLNYETPKEILKKFNDSFIVKFDNPIVNSSNLFNKQVGSVSNKQSNGVFTLNNNTYTTPNQNNNLANQSLFKNNKSIGIFYYSKYIGKEFIDHRKINLSFKKFENKFLPKKIQIDTELTQQAFMETINNINSNKKPSTGCLTKKKETCFKFPIDYEELFTDKEEKEAKVIQNNFNRLQEMVAGLKIIDNEVEGDGSKIKLADDMAADVEYFNNETKIKTIDRRSSQRVFYNNNTIKMNFNEELFDMLNYKGVKIDAKHLNENANNFNKRRNSAVNSFTFEANNFNSNINSNREFKESFFDKRRNSIQNINTFTGINSNSNSKRESKQEFINNKENLTFGEIKSSILSKKVRKLKINTARTNTNSISDILNYDNDEITFSSPRSFTYRDIFNLKEKKDSFSNYDTSTNFIKKHNNNLNIETGSYKFTKTVQASISPSLKKLKDYIIDDIDGNLDIHEIHECNDDDTSNINEEMDEHTTPVSIHKFASNFFASNRDYSLNQSENEIEHRMSNVSEFINLKTPNKEDNKIFDYAGYSAYSPKKSFGTNNSEYGKKITNRRGSFKVLNSNRYNNDSESKNSSEYSKYSIVSRNKSDNTNSYISEISDDFMSKN